MSLVVQIGSDVNQAVRGIELVTTKLNTLGSTLPRIQQQVSAFGGGVNRFVPPVLSSSTALTKLTASSNQSTLALVNLGRVVQDAPFGFLGIANNLNPLLESFQRLKASTGSTGGALRALASSLKGPGGIGIAISVVSSLLIVFGDKLFGASKKAKEADESITNLSKGLSEQLVKLTSLTAVVANLGTSYGDKQQALKKLNEEYGPYLKSMGIEEVTTNNLTKAYNLLIDSLLRQAVVKGLQEQISKSVEETAKQIIQLQISQQGATSKTIKLSKDEVDAYGNVLDSTQKAGAGVDKLGQQLQNYNNQQRDGIQATIGRQAAIDGNIRSENTYEKILQRTKNELKAQLAPLFDIIKGFNDLGETTKETADKADGDIKRIAKAIQELLVTPQAIIFSDFDTDKQALAKARATIQGFFDGTIYKLKIQPELSFSAPDVKSINLTELQNQLKGFEAQINIETDPTKLANLITAAENTRERIREIFSELTGEILKVFDNIDQSTGQTFRAGAVLGKEFIDGVKSVTDTTTFTPDQKLFEAEALTTKFKKQFEELGSTLPAIDLSQSFFVNNAELQAKLDALKNQVAINLNSILTDINTESLANVGEAIGAALSGGDLKGVFENFGNIIGEGLQAIGRQIIQIGVVAILAKKALKTLFANPALAIAAGVALVAAGAALKNIVSGGVTTGRQSGGPVQGGKPYMVGEVGSELYVPKSGNPVMIGEKGRGLFVPPADGKIISRNELNKSVTNNDYTSNKTSKQAVQYVSNIGGDSSEVSNNTKKQSSTENKNATNNIYGTGYYLSSNRYVASDTRNVSNNSSSVSNVNTGESISNITKGVKVTNKVSPVLKPVFRSGIYNPSFVKVINTESSESNIGGSLVNRFNESNNYDSGSVLKYITSNTKQSIIDKERVNELINSSFSSNTINKLSGIGVELKAVMPGTPKRQVGGAVAGGQTILVGERGVEAFVPSTSGRIIPNNNLSQIQGAASQLVRVEVDGVLKGRDLQIMLSRESKYQRGNV